MAQSIPTLWFKLQVLEPKMDALMRQICIRIDWTAHRHTSSLYQPVAILKINDLCDGPSLVTGTFSGFLS